MIDVKQPLRTAYFQLLSGALSYNGSPVPVGDELTPFPDALNVYVILSSQSDTDISTFQTWDSDHEIVIDIVFKAVSRANKQVVDGIANQIINLILPSPQVNALPPQIGIQILNVTKVADRDIALQLNNSNTVIRRLLTYRQYIRQTGDTIPWPIPAQFKGHITSADFSNATDYINPALLNVNFYLFDNDVAIILTEGVDYQLISGGGIRILINNFDATTQSHDFYILLK